MEHLLYLSEAEVAGASIPLDRLREVVAEAFAAQARGTARAASKSVLTLGSGHVFQAKPAALQASGYAGMKWFGLVPAAQTTGPTICSPITPPAGKSAPPLPLKAATRLTPPPPRA